MSTETTSPAVAAAATTDSTARKWYVFDKFDCMGDYDNPRAGGVAMEQLAHMNFEGLHMVHMRVNQFETYCKHNNLQAALNL